MLGKNVEKFNNWNIKKQSISQKIKVLNIKERDIVFVNMGLNIGIEQDGKGEEFLRPIIVFKKFNRNQFIGIPLTTQTKTGKYYFKFQYLKDKINYAVLSQLRVFDTKRVKYKSGVINKKDFNDLYLNLMSILTPTDVGESRRNIDK